MIPRVAWDGVERFVESVMLERTEVGMGVERVGSMVVRRGIVNGIVDWGVLAKVDEALERDGEDDADRFCVSRGRFEAGENDDGGDDSVEATREDLRSVVLGDGEAGGLW